MPRNEKPLPGPTNGIHEANRRTFRLFDIASRPLIPRLEVFQQGHLDALKQLHADGKPIVFAANHLSFLDPLILDKVLIANGFPDTVYMASTKHLDHPAKAWAMHAGNTIRVWPEALPTETEEAADAKKRMNLAAMRTARDALLSGRNLLVFWEGTRSRSGVLTEPADGIGTFSQMTSDTVIAPIGITGTELFLPPEKVLPRRSNIAVTFGEPQHAADLSGHFGRAGRTACDAKAEHIMREIARCLPFEYRGDYAPKVRGRISYRM